MGRKPGRGKIKIKGINQYSWYRAGRRHTGGITDVCKRKKARGKSEYPPLAVRENAGERRGNKAWSARWELGPRTRLRACGREEVRAVETAGVAGALKPVARGKENVNGTNYRFTKSPARPKGGRDGGRRGLSRVQTTETARLGKAPKVGSEGAEGACCRESSVYDGA
ncbi:hypothetical protein DFH09DRAFT_1095069 [Mycena vulgaris]|nr:hypothetical protein DFH09DRAFT_1095069 [Mycena vulgaris]